jgi:Aspartyl protease/PDZ domain
MEMTRLREYSDNPWTDIYQPIQARKTMKLSALILISNFLFAIPISVPAEPPAPYSTQPGKTTAMPIRLVAQTPILSVSLNHRKPGEFFFDSGAPNSITPDAARQLGLKVEWGFGGIGMGNRPFQVGRTDISSIQIGGVTLRNQTFTVVALPYAATHGFQPGIIGTLGYGLLKTLAVEIDYDRKTLTLFDGRSFRYTGHGIAVPFFFKGTQPVVKGTVDGIPGTLRIDTGSDASLSLFAPFVKANALTKRLSAHLRGFAGEGLGGPETAYFVRSETVSLGGIEVHDVVTELLEDTGGIGADGEESGNVGTGILKQFNITFDYPHHMLYFDKNANFGRPDLFNRSGLAIQLKPEGIIVASVLKDSPAEKARIRSGDQIIAIDGLSGNQINAGRLFDVFWKQPCGTVVRLRIRHLGETRDVRITLRDIL